MRGRPIIFSTPMVRAITGGKKTQTRRIVSGAPEADEVVPSLLVHRGDLWDFRRSLHNPVAIRCPYGVPGDRLWVKETHARFSVGEGIDTPVPECVAFRATVDADGGFDYVNGRGEPIRLKVTKWTPALFMPRWASRITLELTDVRVQRMQDISEDDILAEGVDVPLAAQVTGTPWSDIPDLFTAWRLLWDHINGERRVRVPTQLGDNGYMLGRPYRTEIDRSGSWEANPWVWALTFKRVEQPR